MESQELKKMTITPSLTRPVKKLFVTKYESSPFSEGFAVVKTERGYGFMDKTGSFSFY